MMSPQWAAGSPGRRSSNPSTYPSALSGNPQQIMEDPGCVGRWSPR
ncbi:MAG: hypothetical protein QOE80_870 [Actinomycetota bacterium]|jgi:hypothetical protein|nr:hypothetical protein [Actinomycetota bacterium]